MALVSCEELWIDRSGSIDSNGQRRYHRTFESIVSSVHDGPIVASSSVVIPLRGQYYQTPNEVDLGAFVTNINPRQGDSPFHWLIDVEYESILPGEFSGFDTSAPNGGQNSAPAIQTPSENPLLRRVVLDTSYREKMVYRWADLDGVNFLNSAFEPFDNPPQVPIMVQVLTFKKNMVTLPENVQASFFNCYNTDTWRGKEPGTCYIRGCTGNPQAENNIAYIAATWVIEYCPDEPFHPVKVLDQGFKYLVAPNRWVEAQDPRTGAPAAKPVLLDGNGGKLGLGQNEVYLDFRLAKPLNFGATLPF